MIKAFSITKQNLPFLIEKLHKLDPHRQWVCSVIEKKSKRTLDQNRRLWDLYTAIGNYLGEDKDKIHELMGYKFLRYQDVVAGEQVECIKSTTKLDTKEMAEYQEAIERWAAQHGFVWEQAA